MAEFLAIFNRAVALLGGIAFMLMALYALLTGNGIAAIISLSGVFAMHGIHVLGEKYRSKLFG